MGRHEKGLGVRGGVRDPHRCWPQKVSSRKLREGGASQGEDWGWGVEGKSFLVRGHLRARRSSRVCEDPKAGWDVVKAGAGLRS